MGFVAARAIDERLRRERKSVMVEKIRIDFLMARMS